MDKALRQFLVFFILICAVFLVVISVQTFLLGEKQEGDSELPNVIGSETPPLEEESPSTEPPDYYDWFGPPTDDSAPPDDDTQDDGDTDAELPAVQEGMKRVPLTLPGRGTLLIDYFEDIFEHQEQDYDDVFLYISPDGGSASMTVSLRQSQSAREAAEHFFDDVEGAQGLTQVSEKSVGRTGIIGQHVAAMIDDYTFEALVIDTDSGSVAFVIKYNDDMQRDILHDLINNMGIA